jgi:anti-sigma B factor antagonist
MIASEDVKDAILPQRPQEQLFDRRPIEPELPNLFTPRIYDDVASGVTIKIAGQTNILTASAIQSCIQALIERRLPSLLIEFKTLRHYDSTGLAVLITGIHKLRKSGCRVRLICLESDVALMLRLAGLDVEVTRERKNWTLPVAYRIAATVRTKSPTLH